ncbi:MAG: DUF4912 domain-containing protein [Treponema sp.]|jgi:hypothetical protein|nr:DUF4912 domain-containing protein [Treponema sp.]
MDDPRLTRAYLDSLSTNELAKLADRYGIDIPPGLERIFIIEELLDVALEDGYGPEEDAEPSPVFTDFLETAALPKQYNITFLEVLIRDPLWAFVFWEIKSHDKELYEKAPDFGGYYLKVIPLDGGAKEPKENSFTVSVGMNDTAWYLGFPPAEGRYQVDLCVLRGNDEIVLAVSRPLMLPRMLNAPFTSGEQCPESLGQVYLNPLAELSGAGDFPVIRSADRLSRTMRHSESF